MNLCEFFNQFQNLLTKTKNKYSDCLKNCKNRICVSSLHPVNSSVTYGKHDNLANPNYTQMQYIVHKNT